MLVAFSEAGVLATIRSRCCAYSLAPVSEAVCAAYLRKNFPNGPDTARYAALFGGKIGTAKKCLSQEEGRARLADALSLAEFAQKKELYGALTLLTRYEKERFAALEVLQLLRCVCSASVRGSAAAKSPLSPARAVLCAEAAGKTMQAITANGNGKLALTLLAARLTA